MKVKTIILTAILLLSLGLPPLVSGQQATPDPTAQAEEDYRFQFDLYRQAYSEYTRTKSVWESSQTLKAEQEALSAAKLAALARDDAMITYTRWLRLQLLEFSSTYEKVIPLASQLDIQNQWFTDHKTTVQSASSTLAFDASMALYSDPIAVTARDVLFSQAQLELKLATLAYFQHQSRALYQPVLKILETKTDIPEVKQGLDRINQLGDSINTEITSLSSFGGSIEAESFKSTQLFREATERLSTLQSDQVVLHNLMIELESRYGN